MPLHPPDHVAQPTDHSVGVSNAVLLGLGVYFVLSIFYVFPPGAPQPADVLLMFTLAAAMLLLHLRLPQDPLLYLALGLFVCWVTLVNAIWFLQLNDATLLKKTAFYLYNAAVFLFIATLGLHNLERLEHVIRWGCVIALFVEVLFLVLVWDGPSRRALGSFNNPNQMGYWALMTTTCMAVASRRARLAPLDLLALGAGAYIVALSLSKAASISFMVLIGLIVLSRGWRRSVALPLAAALTVALGLELSTGAVTTRYSEIQTISALADRLAGIGAQEDDSLAHRGYARILENPHYLALGAGEGVFERLNEAGRAQEFHSTLGNLLMSYGIVGLGLFLVFLFVVFRDTSWLSRAYLVPILLYGITHMGLRESLLWIFFGLVYAQRRAAAPAVVG